MESPHKLRTLLKARRQQLPDNIRYTANTQVCARVQNLAAFHRAKRIAAYLSHNGEVDIMPILNLAHALGKQCYLPVLHPFLPQRLLWAPWHPTVAIRYNRFAIGEPIYKPNQLIKPIWLDMVLVPLVGFDQHGHRLGMGGGFYDYTFAHRRYRQHWQRPLLLGMAFNEQACTSLDKQPWDVPMDAIITPGKIYQTTEMK